MPAGGKMHSAVHVLEGGLGAVRPAGREAIAERLERLTLLDPLADLLQRGVRAAGPSDTAAKDVLRGPGPRHPLHPPPTHVGIGTGTSPRPPHPTGHPRPPA